MPAMPSSDDVAVWLRFQIAAGRLFDDADSSQMNALAHKLGVTVATISAAYDQVCDADTECRPPRAVRTDGSEYSEVASLIDQIVELDGFESAPVLKR